MAKGKQQFTNPDEGLLRRAIRSKRGKHQPILDQITGRLRAPTAAFEPRFPDPAKPDRKFDEALSVNVQSLLAAAHLPLIWGADLSKYYVARVTVADCSANNLEVWHSPILPSDQPANPYHGLIWGLVEMHKLDELKYERIIDALSRASTIVAESLSQT